MLSKRKKNEARKAKKEERGDSESQDMLNPKTLEILLSAHARTSQADTFASGSEGLEEYDLQTALC